MADAPSLSIDVADELRVVHAPAEVTFGRAADIVIDEANRYLHRVVGRFFWHGSVWWLENLGEHIELEVVSDGGAVVRLPARRQASPPVVTSLTGATCAVRFDAGAARYQLQVTVGGTSLPEAHVDVSKAAETAPFGKISLTDEERQMLVTLAAPCLRDPTSDADDLPTNRQVAHELGWPISKLNRKLDYLCTRLTKAGVRGLQGGRGSEALNRRWRLVEHAINARLVTPADLTKA